jgi:hypothetical protein
VASFLGINSLTLTLLLEDGNEVVDKREIISCIRFKITAAEPEMEELIEDEGEVEFTVSEAGEEEQTLDLP